MSEALEVLGVRFLQAVAAALPEPAARAAGPALGRAAFAFGMRRRVALDNLARAFGDTLDDAARRDLGRRAFEHVGTSLLEFLRQPRRSRAWLRAHGTLEGREHLQAALAAGRGAIVASGHLGNWELGGAMLVAADFPVTFVVQRMRNLRVDARADAVRRGAGIDTVERGALRGLHRALAANRLVFMMCDQDARQRGVFVPFFGVPASTPTGAARLAFRLGVPMLPAFTHRREVGVHHMHVHPPLVPPAGAGEDDAVVAMMAAFNRSLEQAVRATPEQYWWAHRRWKTSPHPSGRPAGAISSPAG